MINDKCLLAQFEKCGVVSGLLAREKGIRRSSVTKGHNTP